MRLYARCQWIRAALNGEECGKEAEFYHPPTRLKYCAEHALAFRNTLLLAALKPTAAINGHEPEPRRPKCQWISASGATEPDCGMESAVTDTATGLHFCLKHAKGLDGQRELIPVKPEVGGE